MIRRLTTVLAGETGDGGYSAKFQGMSSSTCDTGCMSTIRRSVTVRYVCGLTPLSLQVPSSEAQRAQVLAPSSLPAKSRVWEKRNGAYANLVRIFVRNLRCKLGEDAANPAWIFNERGVGYRMAEPGEQ